MPEYTNINAQNSKNNAYYYLHDFYYLVYGHAKFIVCSLNEPDGFRSYTNRIGAGDSRDEDLAARNISEHGEVARLAGPATTNMRENRQINYICTSPLVAAASHK